MYGAHTNVYRSKLDLTVKKLKNPMYDHHFSNFGRPPVPDDLCKDSATRHPQFWRRRFFKVFYHIWAWRPSWSNGQQLF